MNIYFSGIGGVGLAPLAQMSLDAGYTVAGSDMTAGLATEELSSLGIPVHIGEQDGSYLREAHSKAPIDFFVYTAALPDNHPELATARELNLTAVKRDGLLAHIIKQSGQKLIAIAGTHGKTTTTGMMVWVFKQFGIPVSYSVGSQLSFGPSGKFDPSAQYFIYECDEFDRNFLNFHPSQSIITSIKYDHPDTYPTEQDYLDAFGQFIRQSDNCIMWQQDLNMNAMKGASTKVQMIDKHNESISRRIDEIQLPGRHNRENAYLVLTDCTDGGLDEQKAKAALETFPGTVRRFEKLAANLYSDYGHHPVEIAATLQMARELSDHVVLVYQPHQNVRQHEIRRLYTDCFESADTVYWLPTYLSRENPDLPVLTVDDLSENITNIDAIHPAELNDDLWEAVQQARNDNKLVIFMGAGSIDGWLRERVTS